MGVNVFPTPGSAAILPALSFAWNGRSHAAGAKTFCAACSPAIPIKIIANEFGIIDMTVKAQLRRHMRKLGIEKRTQAVLRVWEQRLDKGGESPKY